MEGFDTALERSLIAGKLEEAARKYDETSASLRRAAARYRAGSREALGDWVAAMPGVGSIAAGLGWDRHDQAPQATRAQGEIEARDGEWG